MKTIQRVIKTALFFALFFCGFFCVNFVQAYDNSIAHPGIAQMAAELYNAQNDPDLTAEEISWIKQGAEAEDMPTRWFHHFYDPVYNTGFSDLSRLKINNTDFAFITAMEWVQSPDKQIDFALGDRSWQMGLDDYSDNNRQMAFIELGHAIHLLSDMSVPAHSRNSEHVGDNYESFVKKNWEQIRQDLQPEYMAVNNLNNVFTNLALWSNNNFYSERTIESNKYAVIDLYYKLINKSGEDSYFLALSKENSKILYMSKGSIWFSKIKTVDDSYVLSDYSTRLIPKAIGASAGLIEYFISEGENLKQKKESLPWWKNLLSNDWPHIRIGSYGILNQMFGYMVGLGEVVRENFSDYNDVSLNFVASAEAQKLLSQAVVIDPQETAKIQFGDELPNEEIINSSDALATTKTTTPDAVVIVPNNQIDSDAQPEILAETLAEENNILPTVTTTPLGTTSTLVRNLSSSAGFDPVVIPETVVLEVTTTTPNAEALPPPILDNVFSEIIFSSSTQINIFGSVTSSALSVSAFYRPSFATGTPWTELPVAMAVSNTVWQGLFDLTNTENSFIFYSANTATTSEFSGEVRILLDNISPTLQFFNVTSTIATDTTQIDGEFLVTDQSAVTYDLSYQINNGEILNIFSATTSTSFSLPVVQLGNYSFVLRACDIAQNCSEYTTSTTVEQIAFNYIYLDGEQIEDELTLTIDHSPYILMRYTVPAGKKLIIEPGVMVKAMNNGYPSYLSIKGELSALGTAALPIVFTVVKDQTYHNDILDTVTIEEAVVNPVRDWYGISFLEGSTANLDYVDIKYAGFKDLDQYNIYSFDCAVSRTILAYSAQAVNFSHMNFYGDAQTDVCSILSNMTMNNMVFDGATSYVDSFSPFFRGRDGLFAFKGTVFLTDTIFKNYSRFATILDQTTDSLSNVNFENNMFNSKLKITISSLDGKNIYEGDNFYVFDGLPLSNDSLSSLDLDSHQTIYIMNETEVIGDVALSGSANNKFQIILLAEYGGYLEFTPGTSTFDNVEIKTALTNLLWYSLAGRGTTDAPGLYGFYEGQNYNEYLNNNIDISSRLLSMIKIGSEATVLFSNSSINLGPTHYQRIFNITGGNLVFLDTNVSWDYIDENSLSLYSREAWQPIAIYLSDGTFGGINVNVSHFQYGIYSTATQVFYDDDFDFYDVIFNIYPEVWAYPC